MAAWVRLLEEDTSSAVVFNDVGKGTFRKARKNRAHKQED